MMESTRLEDVDHGQHDRHPHGAVHTDVVDDHILVVTVDRVEKKNAFTPKITTELEDALTRLDDDGDLFVGVLTFAGDHTTAGLEMPLFFTDEATQGAAQRRAARRVDPVDPFGLGRRLTKPRITAVQGITFTIGIEIALAGDVVVAASDLRMCQLEPKRGLAPLGGATVRYVQRAGWGNAMYHLLRADEFGAEEAWRIGLVQEVVEPGRQRDRAIELAREMLQCSPAALRHTIANARLALDEDEPAAIEAIPTMERSVQATEDFGEGIASFIERRPAVFTGR
jgi:enoyl-CoA hydratase/carnithine racemase